MGELCKQWGGWMVGSSVGLSVCIAYSSLIFGVRIAGPQIKSKHTNTKSWNREETWLESQAHGSEEQKHLSYIKLSRWQLWSTEGFLGPSYWVTGI